MATVLSEDVLDTEKPEKKRRARGKGSLFKHGLTYWISVSHMGRRIRENTHHTDQRRAREYLDAKLASLAMAKVTGAAVLTSERRRVTVKERLEARISEAGLEGHDVVKLRSHIGLPPPRKEGEQPAEPSRVAKAFGHYRVV